LFAGAGDVGIVTGDYFYTGTTNVWNFGADGALTLPAGGAITGIGPAAVLIKAPVGSQAVLTNNSNYNAVVAQDQDVRIVTSPDSVLIQHTWTFGTDGKLTLANGAEISSSDIGFSATFPSNGPGGTSSNNNSLTVGIANPVWAVAILANPGGHYVQFESEDYSVNHTITGISGPAPGTNVYTLTGTWTADGGAFPIVIASNNYIANVTTIKSDTGLKINTQYGNEWLFDKDGLLTLPNGKFGDPFDDGALNIIGTQNSYAELLSYDKKSAIWVADASYSNPAGGGVAIASDLNSLGEEGPQWHFRKDGNLTLPAGGDILDSDGNSVLGGGAGVTVSDTSPAGDSGALWFNTIDARIYVRVLDAWVDAAPQVLAPTHVYLGNLTVEDDTIYSDLAAWRFSADGNLTLPAGGTISYTPAAPGNWAGDPPTTIQEALDRLAALNPGA
jgi:hypothetical protein